jgi:endoglucanase
VLVPCYKEAIEVVETTLKATLNADLPWNCTRTIYLCDDGGDAVKRDLAEKMGPEVVYVTGRLRQKGGWQPSLYSSLPAGLEH